MTAISRRKLIAGLGISLVVAPFLEAEPLAQGARMKSGTPPRGQTSRQSRAVQRSRQNGGHLQLHVGQSRSALARRAAQKSMRLNFEAARFGVDLRRGANNRLNLVPNGQKRSARRAQRRLANYNVSPKQVSTFSSARVTDRMYAQALRAHRLAIRKWLKLPSAKRREFKATFDAGAPIGTVYSRTANSYSQATRGVFYLKTVPGTNKLFPVSAKVY